MVTTKWLQVFTFETTQYLNMKNEKVHFYYKISALHSIYFRLLYTPITYKKMQNPYFIIEKSWVQRFDDQERNLMLACENSFPCFKTHISCLQYDWSKLSIYPLHKLNIERARQQEIIFCKLFFRYLVVKHACVRAAFGTILLLRSVIKLKLTLQNFSLKSYLRYELILEDWFHQRCTICITLRNVVFQLMVFMPYTTSQLHIRTTSPSERLKY